MKERLVLACECGATLKASDLDNRTVTAAEALWRELHGDHQQVTCDDAARIRDSARQRSRRPHAD